MLEFADDIGADLIAMATYGRTGILLHLLAKSIEEGVVNDSKRPVWTLRAIPPTV
ncbi:MAG: universal stress protein [Bacteroidetes bacterium]|nr:universal stress protein [Bacteroidota bacterium]